MLDVKWTEMLQINRPPRQTFRNAALAFNRETRFHHAVKCNFIREPLLPLLASELAHRHGISLALFQHARDSRDLALTQPYRKLVPQRSDRFHPLVRQNNWHAAGLHGFE